jgi:two-component system sensor histidine kinase UhpB
MFPELAVRDGIAVKDRGQRIMPLRVRLIISIGVVLLVSLACGSALVGWRAASSVRTELRAALDVGAKSIDNGIDELVRSHEGAGGLRRLIGTFNGNRHVRATLLDARGRPAATSELLVPNQPAPTWFRALIGGAPGAIRLAVPQDIADSSTVVLQADPANEISEVFAASRDAVLVLAGFALFTAALICVVIGRALRPIVAVANEFEHVGTGDYHGSLPERGPPELVRLASGFNLMTQRLAAAAAQNRRLNARLLTLQTEERADLARDLHDEIGPLLFAVEMTAATIERLAGGDRPGEIPVQVRAIHDAVARMQRHVRSILGRLRPIGETGLEVAIGRLAAFWRHRRPDIAFAVDLSVEEDRIGEDLKGTIYRVVQEGLSNAIRHARPQRVEISIAQDGAGGVRVTVTDDGIGMAPDRITVPSDAQLGLVGMRERVMAAAGSLSIERGIDGRGIALVARLPCMPQVDAAE